ncbi:MAG TPA: 50S ribosomal protein L29 [Candidatus Bathyarchaeia archaeon]|jgi:large subunit ribosomal protein L29|nr:50S ribosomal protein L29 [Candidatus Bathyarchaeia archaeon]
MPILRLKEIRDMSSEERDKKLGELRTELVRLRTMIGAGGTVENPARVKGLRKTVAQILTVENEEKLGLVKKKQKEKPKEEQKEKRKEKKREKKKQ